jgi:sugar/nucleoside kinase (ribokinase family)
VSSGAISSSTMALALRCASFSVSRRGTQSSFPTPERSPSNCSRLNARLTGANERSNW